MLFLSIRQYLAQQPFCTVLVYVIAVNIINELKNESISFMQDESTAIAPPAADDTSMVSEKSPIYRRAIFLILVVTCLAAVAGMIFTSVNYLRKKRLQEQSDTFGKSLNIIIIMIFVFLLLQEHSTRHPRELDLHLRRQLRRIIDSNHPSAGAHLPSSNSSNNKQFI